MRSHLHILKEHKLLRVYLTESNKKIKINHSLIEVINGLSSVLELTVLLQKRKKIL